MHSGLQAIAHRAPTGATRTRVRWQPYSQTILPMPTPSRSPSSTNYPNTPSSVSPNSPYSTPATSYDSDRIKHAAPPPTNQPPPKESQPKHKHASNLVDQTVKTLNAIWRPQDIPTIFLATARSASSPELIAAQSSTLELLSRTRKTHLPSPVSPASLPAASSKSSADADDILLQNALVPIKGFVHEVLRRSRTSGHVLQTALCYLEAAKPTIAELSIQEKNGEGCRLEPALESRITPGTAADFELDAELSIDSIIDTDACASELLATVKITDTESGLLAAPMPDGDTLKKPKGPSAPLAPLPPLPSPLLCPRRAFLAALILASKFTQDKCYSNRAWAKVSGLPAREISRCERALGDALDWRLWVGKTTPAVQNITTPAPPLPVPKPIARARSESNLKAPCSTKFLVAETAEAAAYGNTVRRSSTLPADAFMASESQDIAASCSQDITMCFEPSVDAECISSQFVYDDHRIFATSNATAGPSIPILTRSPPTPGLSYSPSSTESSSGDRTIQMSSFDDPMPPVNPVVFTQSSSSASLSSDVWPWLESLPTLNGGPSNVGRVDAAMGSGAQLALASGLGFISDNVKAKIPPNVPCGIEAVAPQITLAVYDYQGIPTSVIGPGSRYVLPSGGVYTVGLDGTVSTSMASFETSSYWNQSFASVG